MTTMTDAKIDEFSGHCKGVLIKTFGIGRGRWMYEAGLKIHDMPARFFFFRGLMQDLKNGTFDNLKGGMKYRVSAPVGVQEFVESGLYLGMAGEIFPAVMDTLIEVNNGQYQEGLLTGAIGTAKTTIAAISTVYQMYLLSVLRNPHEEFGLQISSEIEFIFQSINLKLAQEVGFERCAAMINMSPYFKEFFPVLENKKTQLTFPNRILIKAVVGQASGTIGQNVIGGVLDELNFMAVVAESNNSDGSYNQASSLYNSIARRRKSRFMKKGRLPGLLFLVSSKKYPGQFTDIKEEEAKTDRTIFVYDKKVWDIKPEIFLGDWFQIYIGDANTKARVLDTEEAVSVNERHLVMNIPIEYKTEFENDIINALRDIAGVSTRAKNPYFSEVDKVAAVFGTTDSILSLDVCDFDTTTPLIYPKRIKNPEAPRWLHIDLSVSSDWTGISCGYVPEFKELVRGGPANENGTSTTEMLPVIEYDFLLNVKPPINGEIKFFKIRALIYKLRELELPIQWISFDSYQSVDSIQLLRQKGFSTGVQSIDTSMRPYDMLKQAIYDERIRVPQNERGQEELLGLERDMKRGKIDHPPSGSKDLADSMAGVAYGLMTRPDTYLSHDIPLQEVPDSIRGAMASKEYMHEDEEG